MKKNVKKELPKGWRWLKLEDKALVTIIWDKPRRVVFPENTYQAVI